MAAYLMARTVYLVARTAAFLVTRTVYLVARMAYLDVWIGAWIEGVCWKCGVPSILAAMT